MNPTARNAAVVAAAVAALTGAATAVSASPAAPADRDGISVVAHMAMLSTPAPAEDTLATVQHGYLS
ncbi:hypothetical protein ACFXJO_13635 [Streptomyces lavendulae]|uniref:hypothetical protein n=1 Tax=Streptomyces TaxID=1883 RepID=UPI0024772774|nr:hypothetical protein [Streptomyces sp. SPB4]MDH6543653.1 hypothetical protein [Streptomyces sp. SPB4]